MGGDSSFILLPSSFRSFGREHCISECIASLAKEDFEPRGPLDGRAMLGVVAVQNTNWPSGVDDRQRDDFGRQQATEAIDHLHVGGRAAHLSAMDLAGRGDV